MNRSSGSFFDSQMQAIDEVTVLRVREVPNEVVHFVGHGHQVWLGPYLTDLHSLGLKGDEQQNLESRNLKSIKPDDITLLPFARPGAKLHLTELKFQIWFADPEWIHLDIRFAIGFFDQQGFIPDDWKHQLVGEKMPKWIVFGGTFLRCPSGVMGIPGIYYDRSSGQWRKRVLSFDHPIPTCVRLAVMPRSISYMH